MPGNMYKCEVTENTKLAEGGIWQLTLKAPEIATSVHAGQFITLPPLNPGDTFRRPFSVYSVGNRTITIVYQVVGKNTEYYSRLKPGDKLNVFGPCGQPISLKPNTMQLILIGGGCGLASLHLLAQRYSSKHIVLGVGFKTKQLLFGPIHFAGLANSVSIATDDGSAGLKMNSADLFSQVLLPKHAEQYLFENTVVVTCGPKPMMQKVAQIAAQNNLTCLVGMEEMMGCGIGSCKSCAVHMVNDKVLYVCQHGPFLPAEEVFNND